MLLKSVIARNIKRAEKFTRNMTMLILSLLRAIILAFLFIMNLSQRIVSNCYGVVFLLIYYERPARLNICTTVKFRF